MAVPPPHLADLPSQATVLRQMARSALTATPGLPRAFVETFLVVEHVLVVRAGQAGLFEVSAVGSKFGSNCCNVYALALGFRTPIQTPSGIPSKFPSLFSHFRTLSWSTA